MARDNFSKNVIDHLAKRVGFRCSCPDCRTPTSGPDSSHGATNLGVAAHITAASPGGPRYDPQLSPETRSHFSNGIWLCQNCAKLIDDDERNYTTVMLKDWKETAENMAALETRGYVVRKANPFADLERKCPGVIAEMRADLSKEPLVREFILFSKKWVYGGNSKPFFTYYYEDHPHLDSIMTILIHTDAIKDITFNGTPRYNFTEEFVSYLIGDPVR